MIRGIYFEDFQGFKGSNSCRLAPITLIYGPNASGKSTFARAIKLLKLIHGNKYGSNENLVKGSESEAFRAYGWSPSKSKPNAFTLGLKLESLDDPLDGVSDSIFTPEVDSADFRFTLATSLNQYAISQTITSRPSQNPIFMHKFRLNLPQADLTDALLAELKEHLEEVRHRFDVFEEALIDQEPSSEDESSTPRPVTSVSIATAQIEFQKSKRQKSKALEAELIEWFNSSQQIATFLEPTIWEPNFKVAVNAALYFLDSLRKVADFPVATGEFQQIVFDSNTGNLQLQEWFEYENEDIHDDEQHAEASNLDFSVSQEKLNFLLPIIYRNGMLFRYSKVVDHETNPLVEEDPYGYQDWCTDADELYAHESAVAFHRNSEALWLELENAKFIEGVLEVPTEQYGPNQLSSVSKEVLASVNSELSRLTDGRYQYVVNRTDALRPERSTTDPKVRDLFTEVEIPFTEAGSGLSRILPILMDLHDPSRRGLTFIEEPELHLHPRLQADLMDGIVNRLISEDENAAARQFVLETHSESMLLRLQKRIRNGDISKEDVCVLYVEAVNPIYCEDGRGYNRITELSLDHFGDVLDPFPVSFVDLRLNDLL
jgi:predicted ATPase